MVMLLLISLLVALVLIVPYALVIALILGGGWLFAAFFPGSLVVLGIGLAIYAALPTGGEQE